MKKIIQTLYDFTPMSGERLRTIAYENGFAIAQNERTSVLYHYDYERALEGKSVNEWGRNIPHPDLKPTFDILHSFNTEKDDRWCLDTKRTNRMRWTAKNQDEMKGLLFIQKDGEYISFEQIDKISQFMDTFSINLLYDTGRYLYCVKDPLVCFAEYDTTDAPEESDIINLTKIVNFSKLKDDE